jgi:hypothetical protein
VNCSTKSFCATERAQPNGHLHGQLEAGLAMPSSPQLQDQDAAPSATNEGRGSATIDPELPRELVRTVAASLKSLMLVLPYEEYADIVQRIARLRWRCELEQDATASRQSPIET